jgi:hypothetical protein
MKENDVIRQPHHYTRGKYECWDVMHELGIDKCFYLGAAFKYIWRAGHKDDLDQDLKKAITYLQHKVDILEKEKVEEEKKGAPDGTWTYQYTFTGAPTEFKLWSYEVK